MLVLTISPKEVIDIVVPEDAVPGERITIVFNTKVRKGSGVSLGFKARKAYHVSRRPAETEPTGPPNEPEAQ